MPGCLKLSSGTYYSSHIVLRPTSFRQVVRIAEAVFAGTVVSSEPGFVFNGTPAIMLGIRVSAWLKTGDGYPDAGKVYVFAPGMAMKLGPVEVCASGQDMPEPPQLGDPVLVLPQLPPAISQDPIALLLIDRAVEIVFDRGGRITSSDVLLSLPDLRGMERLSQVARHARSVLVGAER